MDILKAIEENFAPALPAQDYTVLKLYLKDKKGYAFVQWTKDGVAFNARIEDKDIAMIALEHVGKFVDWNNYEVEGLIKFVYADYNKTAQDIPSENIVYGKSIASGLKEILGKGEYVFHEESQHITFKFQSKKTDDGECQEFLDKLRKVLIAMSIACEIGIYICDEKTLGPTDYWKVGKVEYNPSSKIANTQQILEELEQEHGEELFLAKYYTLLQNTARPYIIIGFSLLESLYESKDAKNIIEFTGKKGKGCLKKELKDAILKCVEDFCAKHSIQYDLSCRDKFLEAIDRLITAKVKTKNDIIKEKLCEITNVDKNAIDEMIKELFDVRSELAHKVDTDNSIDLRKHTKTIGGLLTNLIERSLTKK